MTTTISTTKDRKSTSHLLHLVLTILTAGVWGVLVWLPLTLWHKLGPRKTVKTVTVAVDEPQAEPADPSAPQPIAG